MILDLKFFEGLQGSPTWLRNAMVTYGVVGSTAHGLSLEGAEDLDLMGVCLEPVTEALHLGHPFEQFIYRTAAIRTGKKDAKSEPGDIDLTVYSLQKFCRLAANGNPTVLLLLYTPTSTTFAGFGSRLRDNRDWFVSKEAGARFMGYMDGQLKRLLGEKGQKRVKRPELEEKYGYDTKYAMHILRLGYQGIEFLETGKLALPMTGPIKDHLMDIREGRSSIEQVVIEAKEIDEKLKDAINMSKLPEHPNREAINKFLQKAYVYTWSAQRPKGGAVHEEHGFPLRKETNNE